jgi:hypothetical protein
MTLLCFPKVLEFFISNFEKVQVIKNIVCASETSLKLLLLLEKPLVEIEIDQAILFGG